MPDDGLKKSTTPPLTGGTGRPFPEYADLLVHSFDSVEETFDLTLSPGFIQALEDAKGRAAENEPGVPEPFTWQDEHFHIAGHGSAGGTKYILASSRFIVRIRNPETAWCLSVRYLAGALWGEGINVLRDQVFDLLVPATQAAYRDKIQNSLKRADYAFDFYSPTFTKSMFWELMASRPFVHHSSSKQNVWATSERIETITIGSKSTLQVQIYDKGKEIHQVSGKDWMYDLWHENGAPAPDDEGRIRNVWRLEIRFGKEYLRDRGIINWLDFMEKKQNLLSGALSEVRFTKGTNKNRRMRSMHPLWQIADHAAGSAETLPLGRRFTMRRDAMKQMLIGQAIGLSRAISVLEHDDFDLEHAHLIAGRFERKMVAAVRDQVKTEHVKERYRNIDDMI